MFSPLLSFIFYMTVQKILLCSGEEHHSLVAICDENRQNCILSSNEMVIEERWSSYIPQENYILFFCPTKSEENLKQSDLPDDFLILKSSVRFQKFSKFVRYCKQPFKPIIVDTEPHVHEIGYAIATRTKIDEWSDATNIRNGYVWLSGIEITFDKERNIATGSKHKVYGNRHTSDQTCKNNEIRPKRSKYFPFNFSSRKKNKVPTEQSSLVTRQLVPIDDFAADSLKKSTCQEMNNFSLTKSVAEGSLRRVENYIRKVADIIDYAPLEIRTELYYKGSVDQPKNIIKIITYNAKNSIDSNDWVSHHIAIVINTDECKQTTKICESDVCQANGWFVSSEQEGCTYCCTLEDAGLGKHVLNLPKNPRPLNLHALIKVSQDSTTTMDVTKFIHGEHPPLTIVYNYQLKTYQLSDLKKLRSRNSPLNMYSHILLCCPAETDQENEIQSTSKSGISFIREIFQNIGAIPSHLLCRYPYKLLANIENINSIEIGYKIYADKAQRDQLPNLNIYSLNEVHPELFWIPVIRYDYDMTQLVPIRTTYTLTAHTQSEQELQCNSIHFGENLLPNELNMIMNKSYSEDNMKRISKNFENKNNDKLTMYQLTPADHFIDKALQDATCSFMNVIPAWQTVIFSVIRPLNNYLRDLIKRPDFKTGTFEIITSTHTTLSLPLKHSPPVPKVLEKVYLDSTKSLIPAMQYTLKIIIYQIPQETSDTTDDLMYLYYAMVLVIQNHAYWNEPVCQSKCQTYGWFQDNEKLQNNSLLACCTLDKVREFFEEKFYKDIPVQPLDLYNIPQY